MEKDVKSSKKNDLKDKSIKAPISSKENILKYAAKEFLKKGWEKSNIRDIAKKAGLTTGAVYFHFKNKEALFDALVKDTYFELLKKQKLMYEKHFAIPITEKEKRRVVRLEGRKEMLEYAYRNFEAMKLLLCSGKGTKYEDLFDKMMNAVYEADRKAYEEYGMLQGRTHVDIELFNTIDRSFWECLFRTIKMDTPYEKAQRYVLILDDFYEAGWQKICYDPAESYALE
ncbi:TetR/AcrR family transcriptional regulator [Treponema sp. OMZ 799]|uniref:TetR/AcrR family transcriptional regulator n=1 Tax=Treponema sp. OMZ 799 TaxID=2563668 RepID=UPI0020A37362|nr:TetR/AcrR family transcriptional regulator [Treponema sp. OMZ 799]UTC76630.1 TetR/AcrR family transcriptional regulator [Treponema sp. OMZ 799]